MANELKAHKLCSRWWIWGAAVNQFGWSKEEDGEEEADDAEEDTFTLLLLTRKERPRENNMK